jgi:hypothetical protein
VRPRYLRRSVGNEAVMKHSGGADPLAGVAALERASLVFGQTTPDTVVLAGLEGPRQAQFPYVAATAHLLGLFDLHDRGAGVTDGEEQFRIFVQADSPVTPIHSNLLVCD